MGALQQCAASRSYKTASLAARAVQVRFSTRYAVAVKPNVRDSIPLGLLMPDNVPVTPLDTVSLEVPCYGSTT